MNFYEASDMRFWQVDFSYCSHFSTVCSWNLTFHFPHSIIPSLHSALQRALCSARGCESRSHRVSMTKSHGLAETHRSELGGFVDDPVGYLVWISHVMWILNTIFMGTVWRSDDESCHLGCALWSFVMWHTFTMPWPEGGLAQLLHDRVHSQDI